MASFTDKNGRTWTINLDAPTIRKIKSDCDGLNILSADGEAFDKMYEDPLLLCDVVWILVSEEAQSQSITQLQFHKAMGGDAIDAATVAIVDAVKDFSRSHQRDLLEAVVAKNAKIREQGIRRAIQKLNDPEMERRAMEAIEARMDAELEKILTQSLSATNSPDSSE